MDNTEFKAARNGLGLTLLELALILDTDPRTVRKWEAATDRSTARAPNPIAVRVLTWMVDGYRPPEWPAGK
jgi:DNA-binding transcriptional regulator YiaG